mmetsp:Transcript_15552/g.52508  ORF Transcript_15552/g.52508 Transcript_15552/m.52508 type:complete len:402 (+) Transcript_15552:796-2001(+)
MAGGARGGRGARGRAPAGGHVRAHGHAHGGLRGPRRRPRVPRRHHGFRGEPRAAAAPLPIDPQRSEHAAHGRGGDLGERLVVPGGPRGRRLQPRGRVPHRKGRRGPRAHGDSRRGGRAARGGRGCEPGGRGARGQGIPHVAPAPGPRPCAPRGPGARVRVGQPPAHGHPEGPKPQGVLHVRHRGAHRTRLCLGAVPGGGPARAGGRAGQGRRGGAPRAIRRRLGRGARARQSHGAHGAPPPLRRALQRRRRHRVRGERCLHVSPGLGPPAGPQPERGQGRGPVLHARPEPEPPRAHGAHGARERRPRGHTGQPRADQRLAQTRRRALRGGGRARGRGAGEGRGSDRRGAAPPRAAVKGCWGGARVGVVRHTPETASARGAAQRAAARHAGLTAARSSDNVM